MTRTLFAIALSVLAAAPAGAQQALFRILELALCLLHGKLRRLGASRCLRVLG